MATALAICGSLVFSVTAFADTDHGQTGDHTFTDDSSHPGATCLYTQDSSDHTIYWIHTIKAQPPSVWWPDTDSSNTNQHGPVAWRFAVQVSTNGGSNWSTIAHSSYQHATAHEDQLVPYGSSTKAPFSTMSVSFNGESYGYDAWFRIVTRAIWYRGNGSVLGWVKHPVQYYREKFGTMNFVNLDGYCFGIEQQLH